LPNLTDVQSWTLEETEPFIPTFRFRLAPLPRRSPERWVYGRQIRIASIAATYTERINSEGEIVPAVEVKDRTLQLRQLQDKLPAIREKGIRELMFIVQGGVANHDISAVETAVAGQFVTGQNVYVVEWEQFLGSCLVLFGEKGRREFLQQVGTELDRQKADIIHRKKWAALLTSL
jgi:hypothetical protein